MLLDAEKVEQQLREATSVDAAVRQAYLVFAYSRLRDGLSIRPGGHGYIERELRFEVDGDWLYSAVLNRNWILWYFRRPAFNAGLVEEQATMARFPRAKMTNRREINLRVHNAEEARGVLQWIGAEDGIS